MKSRIISLAIFSLLISPAWSQAPSSGRGPGRGMFGGPAVKSPEVAQDGRLTFRLRAPDAKEVFVTLGGRAPMTKDDQGTWTATLPSMEPDYYPYNFIVDGVSVPDPSNPAVKILRWELNNVPHGAVNHHFYHSGIIGDDRDFYVYTPPNYYASGVTQYPVLYLLHGLSDDASAWTTAGRANAILDNLIAHRVRPGR
jgi:hypothetical protein